MKKVLQFLGIGFLAMLFVYGTELISSIILAAMISSSNPSGSEASILTDVIKYQVVVGQLLRLILIWLGFKIFKKAQPNRFQNPIKNRGFLPDSWKMVIIGLGVAGFGNIIISLILTLAGDNQMVNDILNQFNQAFQANTSLDILIMFLGVVILAPICEEIIFRGIVFEKFNQIYSLKTAIILNGLLFGIYHMNILQGINTFFMGMVLAYVYYYRRNITDAILVHLVNNLLALGLSLYQDVASLVMIICLISIIIGIKFLIAFKKEVNVNRVE